MCGCTDIIESEVERGENWASNGRSASILSISRSAFLLRPGENGWRGIRHTYTIGGGMLKWCKRKFRYRKAQADATIASTRRERLRGFCAGS
jgi:hypothetical protein